MPGPGAGADASPGGAPPPPEAARRCFGDRLELAVAYAGMLAGPGVERGIVGPREAGRLWDRHLLNCAVVAELVPEGARVCDLGSGAGLPGIVLAIARPDLEVVLLEPLLRRTVFLQECVTRLGLNRTTLVRGRAEEHAGRMAADIVTARAVAPLERLVAWALPLLRPEGELLALKGAAAAEELAAAEAALPRLGASAWSVAQAGGGVIEPPTTVVRVRAAGGAEANRRGRSTRPARPARPARGDRPARRSRRRG